MTNTITLSDDELIEITGHKQPCAQLRALHQRGFIRAYRLKTNGRVILERDHYIAVCRGDFNKSQNSATINTTFLTKRAA